MQKRLILGPLLLFLASAGPATAPVADTLPRLAKYIDSGNSFEINNDRSAAVFAQDRKELGDGFHAAALRFVKDDAERHYWIGCYLTTTDYLKDDKADPQFALLLFEQGLVICGRHKDTNHAYRAVSLHVLAAITAQNIGFMELARSHKAIASNAIKQDDNLLGGFPALGDEERKVYDAIALPEKP